MAGRIVPALFVASIFLGLGVYAPMLPKPGDDELAAILGSRTTQNLWDVLVESRYDDIDRSWTKIERDELIRKQITFEEPSDRLPGSTYERVWFASTGDGHAAGTLVRRGPLIVVVRGWRVEDPDRLRSQVRAAAAVVHARLWLATIGSWALGAVPAGIILVYRRRRTQSEVPLV